MVIISKNLCYRYKNKFQLIIINFKLKKKLQKINKYLKKLQNIKRY